MATSNKTYARLASLIGKLVERLSKNTEDISDAKTAVGILQDRITHTDSLVQQTKNDLATANVQNVSARNTLVERIEAVDFKNNKREEAQTLRDQSNVQSLVNLRDSVAKAFDKVAADVKQILNQITYVKDRVAKLEVQNEMLAKAPGSSMPSDHVWVNRKLTGVYDSLTEQEQRIEKLEALIEKYETLRKAQADLARENGNFLS